MCNVAHPSFIHLTRFHPVAENRHDNAFGDEPSRNTSFDIDNHRAIEGVHPKEWVTQFGTPGYNCECTANFVEGNHQPPLRRPLAPRGLGHLPDALSQSKELPTRRSWTNHFLSNQRLPQCNPRPQTLNRELIPHQNLRQVLWRSTNLNQTLSGST